MEAARRPFQAPVGTGDSHDYGRLMKNTPSVDVARTALGLSITDFPASKVAGHCIVCSLKLDRVAFVSAPRVVTNGLCAAEVVLVRVRYDSGDYRIWQLPFFAPQRQPGAEPVVSHVEDFARETVFRPMGVWSEEKSPNSAAGPRCGSAATFSADWFRVLGADYEPRHFFPAASADRAQEALDLLGSLIQAGKDGDIPPLDCDTAYSKHDCDDKLGLLRTIEIEEIKSVQDVPCVTAFGISGGRCVEIWLEKGVSLEGRTVQMTLLLSDRSPGVVSRISWHRYGRGIS